MPGATNERTVTPAAIKRASQKARAQMDRLDQRSLDNLADLYRRTADDLHAKITAHAGPDGNLRLGVLRTMLDQVNGRLKLLEKARNDLFGADLMAAAKLGAEPFHGVDAEIARVAHEAVQFIQQFIAEDGLQLADRIWRIDRHARDSVTRAIESSVIQGHSASQSAADLLQRGQEVPADVLAKAGMSNAGSVAHAAAAAVMTGDGSPYANALRLFRTELNRAHGEAYRKSAFQHPDVIGTRFLLSPNHPKTDVCDMHASVNLHGLGAGVYPKGASPWPAHPNTLSYEEAVFLDEVTPADRSGQESRTAWLKRQPAGAQADVLGGLKKAQAFRQGRLPENAFGTPWKVLKQRFASRGIEIEDMPRENVATPASRGKSVPPAGGFGSFSEFASIDAATEWAAGRGTALFPGGAKLDAINSALGGITRVLDPHGIANTEIGFNRRLGGLAGAMAGTSPDGSVRWIRFAPGPNKNLAIARDRAQKTHAAFVRNRQPTVERFSRIANDQGARESVRRSAAERVEFVKAAKRWTICADPSVADPIAATASHEAGHTLYYVRQLESRWRAALETAGVRKIDHYRVSEYAATSPSELWAEVTSAVHSGLGSDLPENVFRAYQEVLNAVHAMP